jgi:hypothetical protein
MNYLKLFKVLQTYKRRLGSGMLMHTCNLIYWGDGDQLGDGGQESQSNASSDKLTKFKAISTNKPSMVTNAYKVSSVICRRISVQGWPR